MNTFLRWLPRVLFAGGALILAWCAFALLESRSFQQAENRQLEELVTARKSQPLQTAALVPARLTPPTPGLIGRIEIPRLDISTMVLEGTSWATLHHAAGHVTGTAMPGEAGNTAISAHRDTFFRPLRNIQAGDLITLTTPAGDYDYRVLFTRITDPSDTAVLNPTPKETLTLITCYPFYFVGSAPERFIVTAERIE